MFVYSLTIVEDNGWTIEAVHDVSVHTSLHAARKHAIVFIRAYTATPSKKHYIDNAIESLTTVFMDVDMYRQDSIKIRLEWVGIDFRFKLHTLEND